MAKEFLKKHFINEAKAAINRWSNIGGPGGTIPAPGGLVEIDVFPERELIFWGGGTDIWTNDMEVMFEIEDGQTYHVLVDGVSYTCTARKTFEEYENGSDTYWALGWVYEAEQTNYTYPFMITGYTEVYQGKSYSGWSVGLQGSDDFGEALPHTIRIYKECEADAVSSFSTEFIIPTQNHENGMILYEEPLRLDIGWTYTVRIMGQTYECRCDIESEYGMLYLGNPILAGLTTNEGDDQYPFFMANIEQDGARAIGVMIDPNTFPIGEDIHVTCHFKDIGEVRLENASIFENGVYYPSEGYDGFASVKVTASGASGPGLYAVYATREEQIMDWDGLIDGGYFNVLSGSLYNGGSYLSDIIPTPSVNVNGYGFYFDVLYECSIFPIAIALHADGSVDFYENNELFGSAPSGTAIYSMNSADLTAAGQGVCEFLNSKTLVLGTNTFTATGIDSITTILRLPDDGTITTIAGYAFQNARGLTTIDFGRNCNVWAIAENAFSKANGIDYVNIPTSVGIIDRYAFKNNTMLQKIIFEDSNKLQSLATYAFSGCGGLRYLDFGNFNSLSSISDYACYYCSNLKTVDFGNYSALETIGEQAFVQCSKLTGINFGIGSRLHTIGNSAFSNCTALTHMTIPDSVTTLGNGVFYKCTSMTHITIPDSVTTLGEKIFNGCSALMYVRLPYGITTIPEQMFSSCTGLISIGPAGSGADVEIPNNVATIDDYAFSGCAGLTSVRLPETVTSYGSAIFRSCTGFTSIGPAGSGADVELSNTMTEIGRDMFDNCTNIANIKFPSTLTTIQTDAFAGCTGLTSIEFPATLTTIRSDAFMDCTGLTEITICGNTEIQSRAFQRCTSLSIVTVLAETPQYCNSSAFSSANISEIRVPAASVDVYKAASGWSSYADKIVAIA